MSTSQQTEDRREKIQALSLAKSYLKARLLFDEARLAY